jgi:FixJ family two-component response regulator
VLVYERLTAEQLGEARRAGATVLVPSTHGLESIALGHTVRQTTRALGIAPKTVENTRARLFGKLGVRSRAGALAAAYSLGLLQPAGVTEKRTGTAP